MIYIILISHTISKTVNYNNYELIYRNVFAQL